MKGGRWYAALQVMLVFSLLHVYCFCPVFLVRHWPRSKKSTETTNIFHSMTQCKKKRPSIYLISGDPTQKYQVMRDTESVNLDIWEARYVWHELCLCIRRMRPYSKPLSAFWTSEQTSNGMICFAILGQFCFRKDTFNPNEIYLFK